MKNLTPQVIKDWIVTIWFAVTVIHLSIEMFK